MRQTQPVAWVIIAACAARVVLYTPRLHLLLEDRPELLTRCFSWRRLGEGIFLAARGLSPYFNGVFCGSPLFLALGPALSLSDGGIQERGTTVVLAALDFITAVVLHQLCGRIVRTTDSNRKPEQDSEIPVGLRSVPLTSARMRSSQLPTTVAMFYLLNPVTLARCTARSLEVVPDLLLVSSLLAAIWGSPLLTAATLAGAVCTGSLQYCILLVPQALIIAAAGSHKRPGRSGKALSSHSMYAPSAGDSLGKGDVVFPFAGFATLFALFCFSAGILLVVSWASAGCSWEFLVVASRWQLQYQHLEPNVGLYWYFFQEIFPRFRSYFLLVFMSHPLVYVLPATVRLGASPHVLATLLIATLNIFKPYPTLNDIVLTICLMMMHPQVLSRMRMVEFIAVGILVPITLLPVMVHLWLAAGTGNANFFYFQTLAYNAFQMLLVLRFAAAAMKTRKAAILLHKPCRAATTDSKGAEEPLPSQGKDR